MSASANSESRALHELLTSTLALLSQFITSLTPSHASIGESIEIPPNPLRVLSDSARLVKAHTTKLSLLVINKPFTPSAITKVLKELAAKCLSAMMNGVQICEQEKATWGIMVGKEVQARVRRLFKEMEILLKEVLAIAEGNEGSARRDSLSSTGVVWESCDALVELEMLGISGLALQRVQQYRDTIKDAISELRDWSEGDDLDTEGRVDGLLDSDDEGVGGDQDSIDDIFNAANSMPANRPELKELAEDADAKLKKVVILYNALEKRRVATFKHDTKGSVAQETQITRLDELMLHLKRIPHQIDEMASYFYDLDEQGAGAVLQRCLSEALNACELMRTDWNGHEDGFSPWLQKWSSAIS